jgi:hypothetical protein
MQAGPCARKVCVALLLCLPSLAHAGQLRIHWRIDLADVLHALFPPPAPVLSSGHLGMEPSVLRNVRGPGVAIDGRTFVAAGIHYRLSGMPAEVPGSPREAQARAALQALLDSGAGLQALRLGP